MTNIDKVSSILSITLDNGFVQLADTALDGAGLMQHMHLEVPYLSA